MSVSKSASISFKELKAFENAKSVKEYLSDKHNWVAFKKDHAPKDKLEEMFFDICLKHPTLSYKFSDNSEIFLKESKMMNIVIWLDSSK